MTLNRTSLLILAVTVLATGCQKSDTPTVSNVKPPPETKRKRGGDAMADAAPAPAKADWFKIEPRLVTFVEQSKMPREVVAAWVEAGASATWYGLHTKHGDFRTDRDPAQLSDPIPTFQLTRNEIAQAPEKLPTPPVPFGISTTGGLSTDYILRAIGQYETLAALDLKSAKITNKTLEVASGLKNLKVLDISDTQTTDAGMQHLGKITSLTHLDLGRTKITDAGLAHLKGLTNLTRLNLQVAGLDRPGPVIAGYTKLQVLRVGRPGANAETARAIAANMKELRELYFYFDRDKPGNDLVAAFKDMKSVERLHLDADVNEKDVEHFRGMDRLKHLAFEHVHLTGKTKEALQKALPNCKIVHP